MTTMSDSRPDSAVFVHLASGIGNIVLATPLLVALHEMELTIDVQVNGDYPETAPFPRCCWRACPGCPTASSTGSWGAIWCSAT